jgi:hypothetical protein
MKIPIYGKFVKFHTVPAKSFELWVELSKVLYKGVYTTDTAIMAIKKS